MMKFKVSKIPYWLLFGVLGYLSVAVYGAITAINRDLGDSLYGVIDWFAASIIYFFLAAFFGQLIDIFLAKRRSKKVSYPLWWHFTWGFWVLSIFLGMIFIDTFFQNFWVYFFFPFTFGIFLPASSYNLFFPGLLKTYLATKLILNLITLSAFGLWLYSILKKKELIQKIILLFIFFILLTGLSSCVASLS